MPYGPTQTLLLVTLAIIIAPMIANWLRLPGIIGFVLAGTIAGPFVIGILARGNSTRSGTSACCTSCFRPGSRSTWRRSPRTVEPRSIFGMLTFGLPFVIGAVEGVAILGFSAGGVDPHRVDLGVSHAGDAARTCGRPGSARAVPVTTVAGATIITDTLALVRAGAGDGIGEGTGSAAQVIGAGGSRARRHRGSVARGDAVARREVLLGDGPGARAALRVPAVRDDRWRCMHRAVRHRRTRRRLHRGNRREPARARRSARSWSASTSSALPCWCRRSWSM